VISKYGIKTTCKRLAYLSREQANVCRLMKQLFQWRTLYYFDQQSSKRKKETIVAMIAGTKAQTVIAIEKYRLNYEIQFMR
jgi:hypothetical protein